MSSVLLSHLGPEPLSDDFTLAGFRVMGCAGRKRAIKSLLMEQEFLAGVGNIYADEALFRAGIHPATGGGSMLTEDDTELLHQNDTRRRWRRASSMKARASIGIASRMAARVKFAEITFTFTGGRTCPAGLVRVRRSTRFEWRSGGRISARNVSRSGL